MLAVGGRGWERVTVSWSVVCWSLGHALVSPYVSFFWSSYFFISFSIVLN